MTASGPCATMIFSLLLLLGSTTRAFVPAVGNNNSPQRRLLVLKAEEGGQSDDSFLSSATLNATSDATKSLLADKDATVRTASFGDVVRPRYLSSSSTAESNPLVSQDNLLTTATTPSSTTSSSTDEVQVAARLKRRNLVVAIASTAVAVLNYVWQFTHPISPVQLLMGMEQASAPVSVIGQNGKPTVVDFWAPVRVVGCSCCC